MVSAGTWQSDAIKTGPGVSAVRTAMKVPVALVSTSPESRVQGILMDTNTLGAFETVVSAEDVARGRPDPEALLYASQSIGRPPARCVVVGMCELAC